jgi:phage regulator Rha-like protein
MNAVTHSRCDVAAAQDAAIQTVTVKDVARIDSRRLAVNMRKGHQSLFELVKDHRADFEEFGKLRFETGASTGSKTGQSERYAMLNEDQAYLLLTYTRNTTRTRELKVKLVKAFGEARRAAQVRSTEYLPTYHDLHDQIDALSSGSTNGRFVHSNINRLVNKAAGIDAGQRTVLKSAPLSLVMVTQTIVTKAVRGAKDHHEAYSRAKKALDGFSLLIAEAA